MSRTRDAQAAGQNHAPRKPLFVSAGQKVHIKALCYAVTFEASRSDDADLEAMPENTRERLYYLIQDDPKKAIAKLEAAVAEHPNSQTLHNWLSAAYGQAGQIDQAERVMELNYQKHPDYLFARVNVAEMHVRHGRMEEAAAVMDGKWELKELYPDRDVFHATEVAALAAAAIHYFAFDGQIERARRYLDLFKEVSPDQQAVRILEMLLEDSEKDRWRLQLGADIRRQRAQGWGWRWDGVGSWTTEAILQQARDIGIDTDAERLAAQAASAGNFKALQELWVEQISPDKRCAGFWEDFPFISVKVLWERLAPHLVCADLIEHRLHQVVDAEEKGSELPEVEGLPADVHVALELARFLRSFPEDQRAAQYKLIDDNGLQNYGEWLINLVELRGSKYPDQIVEIADVLSGAAKIDRMQSDLAIALAEAGRHDEAIARARAAVERRPDDVWARILAGDVYRQLGDGEGAIRLWREALSLAREVNDWDAAIDRLTPELERLGRAAELSDLIRSHPEPPGRRPTPPKPLALPAVKPIWSDERATRRSVFETLEETSNSVPPITRAAKIGRNDPCPCGSGKKYKKCCLSKE